MRRKVESWGCLPWTMHRTCGHVSHDVLVAGSWPPFLHLALWTVGRGFRVQEGLSFRAQEYVDCVLSGQPTQAPGIRGMSASLTRVFRNSQ